MAALGCAAVRPLVTPRSHRGRRDARASPHACETTAPRSLAGPPPLCLPLLEPPQRQAKSVPGTGTASGSGELAARPRPCSAGGACGQGACSAGAWEQRVWAASGRRPARVPLHGPQHQALVAVAGLLVRPVLDSLRVPLLCQQSQTQGAAPLASAAGMRGAEVWRPLRASWPRSTTSSKSALLA